MTDAANLSFNIDSSGATRATQSLDQMTESSKRASMAAADLIKAQQAQIDQLQQLVLMQGQVSQGHSSLSSTIMPLAGALAIGAGSFAAVNYAMNSFTDLIQNKVGSAIDALNQRLYTSFSLMGSLGLNNGNIGNSMMASQLNQQVTGISPSFSLQSQYVGTVLGVSAQTGYNTGMAFGNPYNLQMQTMMGAYGINGMNGSPQNQQALIQAMLAARPSETRTQDFAALGYSPADIQAAYVQQQRMSARNPYEVYRDNVQISASEASIASQANSAQWSQYATQEYAKARALPSLTSSAETGFSQYIDNSWIGRFLGTGPNQYTSADNLAAIRSYGNYQKAQGSYGFQDLLNHFDGQQTNQSIGQDLSQAFTGFMAPTYATTAALRNDLGLGINPQYFSKAPAIGNTAPSQSELNTAAQNFSATLSAITPSADQLNNIRGGWNQLNDLLGQPNGSGKSLPDLLQGYTDNSGNFQPGAKQALQGLPNGNSIFQTLSDIVNGQLNDRKNFLTNPYTYQNTVSNQANMSIAMASSGAAGGMLQAQYGALQKMGLDPTAANIAAYQNDPAFQSNMQAFYQQPFANVGLQNQASNLTMAQLQILSSLPANDRGMYSGAINTLTAPGTLGNIAVSSGMTNNANTQVLAYIAKQAAARGASPAVISQLQAMAGVEGGGLDVHSTTTTSSGQTVTGVGPGQLTLDPGFLKSIGVKDVDNWQDNVNGMITYFGQLLGKQGASLSTTNSSAINGATYSYNGSGPGALNYVGKVDNMSGLMQIPGAAGVVAAANASALLNAQTNQQLGAIGNQYTLAAGADLASGAPGSGFAAQADMIRGQAAQAPTVEQGLIYQTGMAQLQDQAIYRFNALQGQSGILNYQNSKLGPAYEATGLTPSQYNQGILAAQGLAAAAPVNAYQPPALASATNAMYVQNAQMQANQQAYGQIGQQVNLGAVLQAQSQAGPSAFSQDQAAFVTTVGNSAIDPSLKAQIIAGYIKNQNQGVINAGNSQLAIAALNNSSLAAQANISPFLSPTQQAMQLGQIQITQAQNLAYGLVNPNGTTNPMNPQQQAQTAALIGQNNQQIQNQQAVQQQQQASQSVADMSDTVVTALEKLATGGYNAGYILKAAASNIAGLGAQSLVFQPLSNTISQGFGDIGSALTGGNASPITGGGIFGGIVNSLFGLGNNGPNGTGGHSGASVSSGGTSIFGSILGGIGSLFGLGAGGLISGGDFGYSGAGGSFSAASLAMHQGATLARGGVLSGGQILPFADGGVFDQPTTFPMAGGTTGLMGEAGPEAIVPLTRGPDGKLGVASSGGQQSQSGASVMVHAPITVSTGNNGKMTAAQQADMQSQFQQTLYTAVKAVISNEQRNGGTLSRY